MTITKQINKKKKHQKKIGGEVSELEEGIL
jgi:hypothetical protein